MSDSMFNEPVPALAFQHVKATTAVFVGITEVAYRHSSDQLTGEHPGLESTINQPVKITSWSHYQRTFGHFLKDSFLPDAVYGYFAGGARGVSVPPCYVIRIQTALDEDTPRPTPNAYQQAFQALASLTEKYLLLCPDLAIQPTDAPQDLEQIKLLQKQMIAHCEARSGCFAILDSPPSLNAQEVWEYRQLLETASSAAALYYPWVLVPDLSDSPRVTKYSPPCGHIANIFFRAGQEYGRLLAPANEVLFGTLDLQHQMTQGEEDVLLGNQLNCIRYFSGRGIRLWGARTLGNDLIVVGNETKASRKFKPEEPRIPSLENLETVKIAAFIGKTREASIKATDSFSGEVAEVKSVLNKPILVTSWQAFTAVFGGFLENAYLPDAVYGFFANGGKACYVVSVQTAVSHNGYGALPLTIDDFRGDTAKRTGLAGLEALDDVELIACPDLMQLDSAKFSEEIKDLQRAMLDHCELMGNRMAILDTPPDLDAQQALEWRHFTIFDSSHGATYYPWVYILDKTGRRRRIPPSGHIAGLYQRQSRQIGPHKPPANAELIGAVNLEYQLTNGETDTLTPWGVNCLRAYPGRGIRPYGARTLSSDGFYRYIHTRRMLIMIKTAVYQGTSWVQFEQHDLALVARVRQQITEYLETLRLKGILIGETAEEAYFVQCDEELNPPEMRERGELSVKIGVMLNHTVMSQLLIRQANSLRRFVAEVYY